MKNRIEQAHFVAEVARRIGVREDAVWEEIRAFSARTLVPSALPAYEAENRKEEPARTRGEAILARLVGIFLWKRRSEESAPPFIEAALKEFAEITGESFDNFAARLGEKDKEKAVFETMRTYGERISPEHDIKELLRNLKESAINARIKRASVLLENAEKSGDDARAVEISRDIINLKKALL